MQLQSNYQSLVDFFKGRGGVGKATNTLLLHNFLIAEQLAVWAWYIVILDYIRGTAQTQTKFLII